MRALIVLAVLVIKMHNPTSTARLESATNKKCIGPVQLNAQEPSIPIDDWYVETHQVLKAPLEISVLATRIVRKTRYCPDSFTGVFGATCERAETFVSIGEDEEKNTRAGMCKVGDECSLDTCAGYLSIKCKSSDRAKLMPPTALNWVAGELKMIRYSCIQSWGCEIREFTASPHAKADFSGFKIKGLAGEDLELSKYQTGSNGWVYWMNEHRVEEATKELRCIGTRSNKLCRYQISPPEFVLITGSGGRDRNYIVRPNNSLANDGWGDLTGPTTTDELKHSLTKIVYSDLKNRHNTLSLLKKLAQVERQILALASGDMSKALREAVGGSHDVFGVDGVGFMICPSALPDSTTTMPTINIMESTDVILDEISTKPVIDEVLQTQIFESLAISETHNSEGEPEAPLDPSSGLSFSWAFKELLFMCGSISGIVSLVVIVLGRR